MARPKILSQFDKATLEKNFLVYTKMKYIEMFAAMFQKFHLKKKLDFALKHIDYQPFKDSLENHDYEFFYQLVESLPQERYKKLMLMHNDFEMVKLLCLSLTDEYATYSNDLILKVWNNITLLIPEEPIKILKSYLKSKSEDITLEKHNYEFLYKLIETHPEEPISQTKDNQKHVSFLGKRYREEKSNLNDKSSLKIPKIGNEEENACSIIDVQSKLLGEEDIYSTD